MTTMKFMLTAVSAAALLTCAPAYAQQKNAAGFITYASHDELVKAARAESGTLSVTLSHTQAAVDAVIKAFTTTYGVKATGQEVGNADQRILLEITAGTHKGDIVHLEEEQGLANYYPHMLKVDFLEMSKKGALKIPEQMINPKQPNVVAVGSALAGVSYNSKVLAPDLVPKAYEDLLNPKLRNSGLMWVDVSQASGLAALFVVWGKDKVIDYTTKLGEQRPVWTTGATRSITAMAAGEFGIGSLNHYHSVIRIRDQRKAPHLHAVLLEPVPVRLNQILSVNGKTPMPATAALFIAFAASPPVQEIFDKEGPIKASVFSPGSLPNTLVQGKKTAFVGWDDIDEIEPMQKRIFESWKFPVAKK